MRKFTLGILRQGCGFMLRVWVFPKLWLWFAVPLGAPALGWAHIFGLVLLGHMLVGTRPDFMDGASEDDKEIRAWSMEVLLPPLMLMFGYLYKSFM